MPELSDEEAERRGEILHFLRALAVGNDLGCTVLYPVPQVEGGHRGSVKTITLSFSMDYVDWMKSRAMVKRATKRKWERGA